MPCGPICPASDALCIAGFKTGWRLRPPTRASFPGRGQATHKKTHWKGNQNQPYLIQLGGRVAHGFPSLLLSFLLPSFLASPNCIRYSWLYPLLRPTAAKLLTYIAHTYGSGSTMLLSAPSFSHLSCLVFFLPPTLSDTVGGPGGIRASDLQAPSLNCLVVHPLDPPKIQNPESKIQNLESKIQNPPIQNPKSKLFRILDFGFWILDRYVAILYVRPPTPQILDFGFRILDFGFWISDFGFWISDFGFWISDFGFWILDRYVAFLVVQILDFGFWISDFGFWISDFGFWISDFGFWILDFEPNFGRYLIYQAVHADPGRRISLIFEIYSSYIYMCWSDIIVIL